MRSINEQLNIAVPRNPNIPSRYTRGLMSAQPQLQYEDWSLDFYNDMQSLGNMSNACGETHSDFLGGYPPACIGIARCQECKTRCKDGAGLKWKRGGKECYKTCVGEFKKAKSAAKAGDTETTSVDLNTDMPTRTQAGMSTGSKVALGIGALAILGTAIYMITKR